MLGSWSEGLRRGGRGRGRAGGFGVERLDEGMLGSARGGGDVSRRTLRGLYGGRVSCHVSIMYGTPSLVPGQQPGTKRVVGWGFVGSWARRRASVNLAWLGSSLGLSVGSSAGRYVRHMRQSDVQLERGGWRSRGWAGGGGGAAAATATAATVATGEGGGGLR